MQGENPFVKLYQYCLILPAVIHVYMNQMHQFYGIHFQNEAFYWIEFFCKGVKNIYYLLWYFISGCAQAVAD